MRKDSHIKKKVSGTRLMKINKGILELVRGKKKKLLSSVFSYIEKNMEQLLAGTHPGCVLFSCLLAEKAKNYLSMGQLSLGQKLPIS